MLEDKIHSIEEAKRIAEFFHSKRIKNILGLNDEKRDTAKTRKALLVQQKVEDIHGLLNNISEISRS